MAFSAETLGGRIGESAGIRRLAVLKRDGTPVRPEGVVVFLRARLGNHRIRVHDPSGVIKVETPSVVFDPPSPTE